MNYRFEELVNPAKLKNLLQSHHGFSGMAYGLFDTDENNLLAVGWQDICTQFHRVHPVSCARCREKDTYLKEQMQGIAGEVVEYRCKNGMMDVAMPIMVAGRHLATFFAGQFFYDDDLPDREFFLNQAEELGFDQASYLAAFDRVPVFSRERIRNNVLFLQNVVEMLAEVGLVNQQLQQETEERKKAEEVLLRREAELQQQNIFQKSLLMALQNAEVDLVLAEGGRIVFCNDSRFGERFGLSEADLAANPEFIRLVHPDDRARVADIYQRRSAGEPMPTIFEIGVQWANGERREVEVVVSVIAYNPLKTLFVIKDITERKRMEEALLQRALLQEQLSAVAEAVPGFIYTARFEASGYNCIFPFASPGIVELLGLRPEDISENPDALRSCYHPDDFPGLLERIDESRRSGGAFRYEMRVLHPGKGLLWIEMRSTVQKLPDGTAVAHGVMIDITERKNAEARLLEMQSRLTTIFTTIPDLIWLKDTSGVYQVCNPAFKDFSGLAVADMIGKTDYDFMETTEADYCRKTDYDAIVAGDVSISEEEVVYAVGGRRVLLDIRKVPVYGADGEVVGVMGIARDITESKKMELQLKQSLDFSTGIINALPDILFEVDRTGKYLNVWTQNQVALAEQKESLLGKTVHQVLTPENAAAAMKAIDEASKNGASYGNVICIVQQNGESRWYEHSLARKQGATPLDDSFIVLSRDITERKRIEEELQAKNSELERFSYTVSHDLKSPIITIKSFSGAIKGDLAVARYDRMGKDLDRICNAADKMAVLLDDLLKLSRSGKVIDSPEPVDMTALIWSVLASLAGTLRENKVQVMVQPDLPVVSCDRQRMTEVLQNLIENAVKYRGDQPELCIEIGLRHDNGRQVFFVQDNGPGIDPRYHDNIFGLFNRLETKIPGTGIGLALVKRIIEVHGGRVWVESDGCGAGSTFCFTVG